ncbi:hypothetical protein PGTUg99_037740 [Puccinia graminis f. sp. tritici]|uniref:Uncharacterized protein n=1 Tax=Puccinia graminis f. sp. tritici TaxID=56615 RepID=A0A5B0SMZ4_PUCGR|nr:hypothetical protein PGTUg99_037740 [Puccinia graminis f. sp. tritici]
MANEPESMISPYGRSGDLNVKRIVIEEVPRPSQPIQTLRPQPTDSNTSAPALIQTPPRRIAASRYQINPFGQRIGPTKPPPPPLPNNSSSAFSSAENPHTTSPSPTVQPST